MKNISKAALLATPLQFPSVTEECALAQVLVDIDADIEAAASRLAKARDMQQAMMEELLTGRIRLLPPASSGFPISPGECNSLVKA